MENSHKIISEKEQVLNAFNDIVYCIKNGMNLENEVRKYDILDYYLHPYNGNGVDINKNLDLIREDVSKEDIIIFKKFISANHPGSILDKYTIKNIFAVNYEVNALKDENGIPISGTGRLITNEEKKNVLDFIVNNNLPLRVQIYKLVMKRYVNGDLELVNSENKIRKV